MQEGRQRIKKQQSIKHVKLISMDHIVDGVEECKVMCVNTTKNDWHSNSVSIISTSTVTISNVRSNISSFVDLQHNCNLVLLF